MSQSIVVLAQAGGGNAVTTLVFLGLMMAVMYFVMILPQQRQAKAHRAFLAALKKGDEVVTRGGMVGKVFLVGDAYVSLEISNGVRVQVLKTSIESAKAPEAGQTKAEEPKEKS